LAGTLRRRSVQPTASGPRGGMNIRAALLLLAIVAAIIAAFPA
jgi:hypothetical protein